jgi:hypothetical protein
VSSFNGALHSGFGASEEALSRNPKDRFLDAGETARITLKVANMKKLRDASLIISPDYLQFIEELKARVVSARITAARAITHEAILLYWDIGR